MVTLRPARAGDLSDLTALLQLLFAIEKDFHGDAALQREGLRMILNCDRCCLMVAENNGRVVGMCSGQLTISTAEGGPALLIEDVIVAPDCRHQGIGRRLIDAVAGWAGERGVQRLQLLADTSNSTALLFYRQLGWKTTRLICLRKYRDAEVPGES